MALSNSADYFLQQLKKHQTLEKEAEKNYSSLFNSSAGPQASNSRSHELLQLLWNTNTLLWTLGYQCDHAATWRPQHETGVGDIGCETLLLSRGLQGHRDVVVCEREGVMDTLLSTEAASAAATRTVSIEIVSRRRQPLNCTMIHGVTRTPGGWLVYMSQTY